MRPRKGEETSKGVVAVRVIGVSLWTVRFSNSELIVAWEKCGTFLGQYKCWVAALHDINQHWLDIKVLTHLNPILKIEKNIIGSHGTGQ